MIKKLKYLLIIFPVILSILLTINIHKYNNTKLEYKNINTNIKNYQNKIKENKKQQEQIINEINSLKESKKDKIMEYERWIKWKQEINSKIN